jgi:hypothetical protein
VNVAKLPGPKAADPLKHRVGDRQNLTNVSPGSVGNHGARQKQLSSDRKFAEQEGCIGTF